MSQLSVLLFPTILSLKITTLPFSNTPMGYIEHKLDKLELYLTLADYLSSTHQDPPNEIIDEVFIGYQEAIKFFEETHNESMLTHPLMTHWIHAYAVSAVVDCKKHNNIDDGEVERALDYIGSKQNADGSFTDDAIAYVRREMGTQAAQKFILTAQIALTFIKWQEYSDKYKEVITEALNFLNDTKSELINDYEKVIVAYTFAVFGDQETARQLTSSMKHSFLEPPKYKKHLSMFVEIASYLIMTKVINNEDPAIEIEWLLNQRNLDGSFYSSYDTLLAYKALMRFSSSKNPKNMNLVFKIDADKEENIKENEIKTVSIPFKAHHQLKVFGNGFGFVTISYEYSTNQDKNLTQSQQENFSIDAKTTNKGNDTIEIELNVRLIAEGMKRTNLVMIEVEMPSGYQYIGHEDAKHIEVNFKRIIHP